MQTLSDRIRQARRAKGWSQSGLAEYLGVTTSAVGHWERPCGNQPSAERLFAIAKHLSVNIEWLVLGLGDVQRDSIGHQGLGINALSDNEQELLRCYRKLPQRSRSLLLQLLAQFNVPPQPSLRAKKLSSIGRGR